MSCFVWLIGSGRFMGDSLLRSDVVGDVSWVSWHIIGPGCRRVAFIQLELLVVNSLIVIGDCHQVTSFFALQVDFSP